MLDAEGLVGALDVHEGHSRTLVRLVGGSPLLGGEELDTLDASIPAIQKQTIPNLARKNFHCSARSGH